MTAFQRSDIHRKSAIRNRNVDEDKISRTLTGRRPIQAAGRDESVVVPSTRLFVPQGVPVVEWAGLTAFQQHVYRVVCTIPTGETRSYRWVAQRIGRPGAARAVGNALHRNPFAPTVPCHRVVRADGTVGGFAWGQEKKRRLLEAERAGLGLGSRARSEQAAPTEI